MERGFCVAPPVCGLCFLGRRIGLGFGQPSHPVEHGTADPCLGLLVGQGLGVQGVAQDMFVVPRILSAVDRQGLRDALAGGLINAYVQPPKEWNDEYTGSGARAGANFSSTAYVHIYK